MYAKPKTQGHGCEYHYNLVSKYPDVMQKRQQYYIYIYNYRTTSVTAENPMRWDIMLDLRGPREKDTTLEPTQTNPTVVSKSDNIIM